jgi:hypothetical protein
MVYNITNLESLNLSIRVRAKLLDREERLVAFPLLTLLLLLLLLLATLLRSTKWIVCSKSCSSVFIRVQV